MQEKTKFRLHSHDVPYGSGSGQQSVTGFPNVDDSNSYWVTSLCPSLWLCQIYVRILFADLIQIIKDKNWNWGKRRENVRNFWFEMLDNFEIVFVVFWDFEKSFFQFDFCVVGLVIHC